MSGRMEQARHATVMWLRRHVWDRTDPADLWMRADDDMRPDEVVKRELYEEHVRGRCEEVEGVIDDRLKVVRMWRDELGLTVLQCADGNF